MTDLEKGLPMNQDARSGGCMECGKGGILYWAIIIKTGAIVALCEECFQNGIVLLERLRTPLDAELCDIEGHSWIEEEPGVFCCEFCGECHDT